MKNNPLLDKDFLIQLDQQKNKKLYAKIISLTIDELPIEEITGKITGGSINIDGTSAIRRSCSVQLVAQDVNINDYYWGINTKFQLFIGIENNIDNQYEKIIWFKQGVFLITNFNTSLQLNGYNISIQGKDKMCLLNGDISGTINSLTVDFGKYDSIDSDGNIIRKDYLIKEIIKEAVHQYAGEPYNNIIIKDLDMTGLELIEYQGNENLYLIIKDDVVTNYKFAGDDDNNSYYLFIDKETEPTEQINIENLPVYDNRISRDFGEEFAAATQICTKTSYTTGAWTVARIQYGDTCGYRETELVYPNDLISNVGESITQSLLDKLVKMLGEYEYFYDIDGHFVFQRKMTYNDNSWNSIQNLSDADNLYVENAVYTSAMTYSFLDSNLITAFQNTPNITNLKNDFSIWGTKKVEDNEIPIHLRYAIDEKPKYYKSFSGKIYLTEDEYYRIQKEKEWESIESTIIIDNKSQFKITPLPDGLSDGWWEIDDWTRRYLYFADVNEDRNMTMEDYINLSAQDVFDIVYPIISGIDPGEENHDFNYFVYKLKYQLGTFAKKWATEDWLNVFPKPSTVDNKYYDDIVEAINNNEDYWAWLIDTIDSPETGKQYIQSIEHGWVITQAGKAPSENIQPGCTHPFSFALTRKRNRNDYHVYIYDPDIPDSLKNDITFIQKEMNSNIAVVNNNFFVCDWREIIYQMAYDYYHYQHNDNYNVILAENNKKYYPDGITKYEQYYIDIYSFWRDLYNPTSKGINSHIVDMSLKSLYFWNGNDFEELSLNSEENVIISKPQDVVDEDGLFYYVSGKDKYTPYVVSLENNQYYLQSLYKDLSSINYDPSKIYIKEDSNGNISFCDNDIGYKRVFLTNTSYFGGYYYTRNENDYILDPAYKKIEFSENLKYLPNKYYIKVNEEFKIDSRKNQTLEEEYYIKNIFDQNKEYYERSIYFTGGYKYYVGDEWQKINNFGAGIQYYVQNQYQYVGTGNGNYDKDLITNIFEINENNNGSYIKVNMSGPNIEIGYEKEIYINPEKEYYEFLSTSSLNIYSKVTAFLKGKRYYYYDNGQYIYDENIVFDNNKIYYKRFFNNEQNQELVNLMDCNNLNYYYFKDYSQGIISDIYTYDKDNKVFNGSIMKFYPGDIYYSYNLQNYNQLDNNYYFLQEQYYYLSTSSQFDINTIYYFDIYGTIASITKEEYQPNKYYIKGNISEKMFTKHNILHSFKKGFDYFIIENKNNKSLITEKKYLLATFYPNNKTIFYDLINNIFTPIFLTEEEFNNRDKNYYLAYGKYNYYCYTNKILNHLKFLQEPYDKNAIYYKTNNINLLKQNYIGQITEDEWLGKDYYTLCSIVKFQESKSYNYEYEKQDNVSENNYRKNKYYYLDGETYKPTENLEYDSSLEYYLQLPSQQIFYLFPSLNSETIQCLNEESWSNKYFELIQDKGIYLSNEFNIRNFWSSKIKNPENLIFWFDFLDISNGGDLAQYSAHNIGDRPKSINDKDVRSIYYRDIPTVIFKDNNSAYIKIFLNEDKFKAAEEDYFIYDEKNNCFVKVVAFDKTKTYYIIKQDGSSPKVGSENYYDTINMYLENENILAIKYNPSIDYYRKWNYTEDGKTGYTYVNIVSSLDNLFSISSQKKSTFDVLDNFLYNNSYCIETIQITAIPIYHLSPNTRILVRDDKTGINGEYIVSKISLPLTYNGTMNISATKAVKRIY